MKDLFRVVWTHNIIRTMIDEDPISVSEFIEVLKVSKSAADNYNFWGLVENDNDERSEHAFDFLYKSMYGTSNEMMLPKMYDDSIQSLKTIKEMGVKMIIVSAHPEEGLKEEMETLGVSEYIMQMEDMLEREIYGSIEDKSSKMIEIMERLNIEPGTAAYVGDTVGDMLYAEAAGVVAIAKYYDGHVTKESMDETIEIIKSKNHPHLRIGTLTDFVKKLEYVKNENQVYLTLEAY